MGLKRGTRQKMDSFLAPIWRVTNLISIYWFKAFPFIHSRKKSKSIFQMVYLTGRRSSRLLRLPTTGRGSCHSGFSLGSVCVGLRVLVKRGRDRAGDRRPPIYATPEFFEMGRREVPPPIEVHQGNRATKGTPSLNDVRKKKGGWIKSSSAGLG